MRQRVVNDESGNSNSNAAGRRMKAWQESSHTATAFLSVQHTLHCGSRFARSCSLRHRRRHMKPRGPQPFLTVPGSRQAPFTSERRSRWLSQWR